MPVKKSYCLHITYIPHANSDSLYYKTHEKNETCVHFPLTVHILQEYSIFVRQPATSTCNCKRAQRQEQCSRQNGYHSYSIHRYNCLLCPCWGSSVWHTDGVLGHHTDEPHATRATSRHITVYFISLCTYNFMYYTIMLYLIDKKYLYLTICHVNGKL